MELNIEELEEVPAEEDAAVEPEIDFNIEELEAVPEEVPVETETVSEDDGEFTLKDLGIPDEPEIQAENFAPQTENSDDEFSIDELGIDEVGIDGLDEAIASETELELAADLGDMSMEDMTVEEKTSEELPLEDISMEDVPAEENAPETAEVPSEDIALEDLALDNISVDDVSTDELMTDNASADDNDTPTDEASDDSLDDILSMLDDDAELAEINDMLKKSDNNEPIQDDMMDLLNQMADDEAKSVNAGIKSVDEDDGGIPLPEIPDYMSEQESDSDMSDKTAESDEEQAETGSKKKKGKKTSKKKDKGDENSKEEVKEPGKMGKFFNMLTEDLVPEPTEEELAAEKAAKEAKKQEDLTKKEEEKLAKAEEKKAKAEEKEAAKKAKAEEAAQKKKEKEAAKKAKAEAKKAKQLAQGPKKRIPPKKIAAAALFGATVGGAVIVATNVLSTQGYLQTARNAYYNQDYKTVYQSTYGMNLDDTKSDGLIQAKSEIILKMQRRYDSYQTYTKMGQELEALDALLEGLATYDYINADAEQYGVMSEVDEIKDNILNILAAKYGLDEEDARALMNEEDALSYTMALNDVINNR